MALLTGQTDAAAAGRALSAEAEACVGVALDLVLSQMARCYGPAPGSCAVLALGKLGGRELSVGSDLDVVFVYRREGETYHQHAAGYFEAAARELVAALGRRAGGVIYDVDMRLRPHGGDGPLAVEVSALADYFREDCWTWELLALTRGRVVAGDFALARMIMEMRWKMLRHGLGRSAAQILADVAEMRQILDEEHPAATSWDVKRAPGGLIDIEFIAQGLQLAHAGRLAGEVLASTPEALGRLGRCGLIGPHETRQLLSAWSLQFALLQTQRALGVTPAAWPIQPKQRLIPVLKAAGVASLARLRKARDIAQRDARMLFNALIAGRSPSRLAA